MIPPRNIFLAVTWRLLLLAAVCTAVLAFGVYRYDWRLVGPKKSVQEPDEIGIVIEQQFDEKAMEEKIKEEIDATGSTLTPIADEEAVAPEPTPTPTPVPTPTPKPPEKKTPTPKPKPKPKPEVDDKGLEDFLDDQL